MTGSKSIAHRAVKAITQLKFGAIVNYKNAVRRYEEVGAQAAIQLSQPKRIGTNPSPIATVMW
jgi:hypothetical protein